MHHEKLPNEFESITLLRDDVVRVKQMMSELREMVTKAEIKIVDIKHIKDQIVITFRRRKNQFLE